MNQKVRVNANIDATLYHQVRAILKAQSITITDFIQSNMEELLKQHIYMKDKAGFDALADEIATKDFLEVERECASDGLE